MPPRAATSCPARSNGGKFQMLKFYFNGSPNPTKVALFLEEAGLAYQPVAVDTRKGDQFKPEKIDYAHNRYQFEAQRHFGILNDHLANRRYMVGDTYTIVDMDVWGWARMIPFVLGEDAVAKYPNVKRLVDEISARPAAAKAIALKDNFKFKAEMDDEARGNMFKHLKVKAA